MQCAWHICVNHSALNNPTICTLWTYDREQDLGPPCKPRRAGGIPQKIQQRNRHPEAQTTRSDKHRAGAGSHLHHGYPRKAESVKVRAPLQVNGNHWVCHRLSQRGQSRLQLLQSIHLGFPCASTRELSNCHIARPCTSAAAIRPPLLA